MALFSIKMRASQKEKHISGAEKIQEEAKVPQAVGMLIARALHHSVGKPDFINVKIEELDDSSVRIIPALPVSERTAGDPEEAFRIMEKEMKLLGIRHPEKWILLLRKMPPMRGAAVFDIRTGERLDPRPERGIRVTYMDELFSCGEKSSKKNAFREALVLASKTAAAKGMVAELCISDDPHYVTGYIASSQNGYIRITPLKEKGTAGGGRIFLFDSSKGKFEEAAHFLEQESVLIENMPLHSETKQNTAEQAIKAALERKKRAGLYRKITVIGSPQSGKIKIGGKKLLLFSSNSYLDLIRHPLIRLKTAAAVLKWGSGSGGSRLTTGTLPLHTRLESALSRFYGTEDALLFNTGYTANVGIISSIGNNVDIIFSDKENHASIIDGCRLASAETVIYRHNDMKDLESKIRGSRFRSGMIVSDSVFSMSGDILNLPEFLALGKKYHLLTMIDEAHALGVLGRTGHGITEYFHSEEKPDLIMGTLSKSVGAEGGFVCGNSVLIDFLRNHARSFIFSTSQTPANIAASLAALKYIENHPKRISRLQKNIKFFSECLKNNGIETDVHSAVISVPAGNEQTAVEISETLKRKGFLIPAIRFPTVPYGKAILRLTLMATHTKKEIKAAANALAEVIGSAGKTPGVQESADRDFFQE